MEILRIIFFFVLVFTPLFFQIFFGSGFITVGRKMKFWLVCVISFLLLFVTYFIHAKIISYNLKKMEIRDGMPFVGLLFIEEIVAAAILLTILIQLLVKYFRNRRKQVQ